MNSSPLESIRFRYPEVFRIFTPEELSGGVYDFGAPIPAPDLFYFLTAKKVEKLGLTQEQSDACMQMAESLIQMDALTGFDKPQYKELNLALIQEHMAKGDLRDPVHYLGSDVSNLRGLNIALSGEDIGTPDDFSITPEGRQRTNQFLKMFSNIMQDEVETALQEKYGAESSSRSMYFRDGGDELSGLVIGLSGNEMTRVQDRIHERIETLMEKTGLDTIIHPKYPYFNARAGAGLACSYTPVGAGCDMEELSNLTEQDVERLKESKLAKDGHIATKARLTGAEINHAMDVLQAEAVKSGINLAAKSMHRQFPFGNYPMNHQQDMCAEGFVSPAVQRMQQTKSAVKELGLDREAGRFLTGLHDIYESVDPVTGYQRHSPFDVIAEGLEYLRSNPGENMHVLIFEMQNFAGMNDKLGHAGCDKVFGDLAAKINIPGGETLYYRPEGRGDRLYLFTCGVSSDEVVKSVKKINAVTDAYVAVSGLNDLPNPRYPEDDYDGVRFVVGANKLTAKDERPQDIFRKLEEQIRDNKRAKQAFNGKALGVEETVLPFSTKVSAQNVIAATRQQGFGQQQGGSGRGR